MIILGILAIVGAFSLFGYGDVFYGLAWAAVGSALIAWGIHRNKQKQSQAQQQTVIVNNYTTVPPAGQGSRIVRATSHVVSSKQFPVAGVTFSNDDGSPRQEILREICEGGKTGRTEAWLEWYEYHGSDAYRVMTPFGCVGNVRRNEIIPAVAAIGDRQVTLSAELFKTDDGREIYRADLVPDDDIDALPES